MNRASRISKCLIGLAAAMAWASLARADGEAAATYIVQSATLEAARAHVLRVGAEPEREFEVIHAVAVRLTPAQLERLRANASVRVFDDRAVKTRGAPQTQAQ